MGILQARVLEQVAMPSSRGIFATRGLNPGFLHCRQILFFLCRQILYQLSHQGTWAKIPALSRALSPRQSPCIETWFPMWWCLEAEPFGIDGLSGEESICQRGRPGFSPWVRKISWRRKWQPTPVFLPGKSHGQRGLAGCSPCGHKESDMIYWLNS